MTLFYGMRDRLRSKDRYHISSYMTWSGKEGILIIFKRHSLQVGKSHCFPFSNQILEGKYPTYAQRQRTAPYFKMHTGFKFWHKDNNSEGEVNLIVPYDY